MDATWGTGHIKASYPYTKQEKRKFMINDLMQVRDAIDGVVAGANDVSELVSALEIVDALIASQTSDSTAVAVVPVEEADVANDSA